MKLRRYIRHPSTVPIEYRINGYVEDHEDSMTNIGRGGLCFRTGVSIELGMIIYVTIRISSPPFSAKGISVWCHPDKGQFLVGIQFADADTEYALRMVEQVCHIEQYRKDVFFSEGRRLTSKEAALEWVEIFAADFPGSGNKK